MIKIPGILKAVQSHPWAIVPEKLEAILELLELRAQGGVLTREEVEARIGEPKKVTPRKQGVIAIIPIYGVISQRMNMFSEYSGGTSTEQLAKQFDSALSDESVTAIVFDVDSPGGSVYGVQELAGKIYGARGRKPIKAVVNPLMASAAYFIASAADEVIITPSGDVGSIGVYSLHMDISGADEKMGVKRTLIRAGRYKAEANPFEALSDDARGHMQEMVDDSYQDFVDAVARHRGTTPAAVRAGYGQGRVLTARRALAEDLVDRIATLDEILGELSNGVPAVHASRSSRRLAEAAIEARQPEFAHMLAAAGPKAERDGRRVALHEAAHCLRMLRLTGGVGRVSITFTPSTDVRSILGDPDRMSGRCEPGFGPVAVLDQVHILMAGPAGEQLAGYEDTPYYNDDRTAAFKLLEQHRLPTVHLNKQAELARAALQSEWPVVQRIADALYNYGELSGTEIARLVGS